MVTKKKKSLKSSEENFLLPEKELTRIRKKYSDPCYQGGNLVLDESASVLDKTKYELCQIILACQQDSKLTIAKIAERIQLSKAETEDILHCRIDKFTLDRLTVYAEKLLPPLRMKVIAPKRSFLNKLTF